MVTFHNEDKDGKLITIVGKDGLTLATLYKDGRADITDKPDEAGEAFWNAIVHAFQHLYVPREDHERLEDLHKACERDNDYLKESKDALKDKLQSVMYAIENHPMDEVLKEIKDAEQVIKERG